MGLLRSEAMKQGVLVLPPQSARQYIDTIGKTLNMQFEDMNSREMRRPYRKYVQRIDEMERIIRFLTQEITQVEGCTITKNCVDEFLAGDDQYKLDTVEQELALLYTQFVQFKENNASLLNEQAQAMEEIQVASRALTLLGEAGSAGANQVEGLSAPLVGGDDVFDRRLSNIAGVVAQADEQRLRLALFRASRGNAFADFFPVEAALADPKTGVLVRRSVFVVYFQGAGGASAPLHQKVSKVCQAMGVNLYDWPSDAKTASVRYKALEMSLREKENALEGFKTFMRSEMEQLTAPPRDGANSKIEEYRLFCLKEKAIYATLNLCTGDMVLRVNIWYPEAQEKDIEKLIASSKDSSSQRAMLMPKRGGATQTPPTYIKTNEYTEPFQDVIDTYGIPRYQEANPALLTVVTFPFIFGMMYGDIGHGSLLLMVGLYLCRNAQSFKFTVPVLYSARYMVLSLGVFALYAGFMYNDFFSISLQLFKSGFDVDANGKYVPNNDVTNSGGKGPYPFGLDWAWAGASNELLFVNSLKMKLSVLFGVLQMTVGLLLRWSNAFYFNNMADFVFECIPMMIFMLCFFGWMDFMVLFKWVHPIDNPPSVINSLICMAMGPMGQEDKFPLWDGSVALSKQLMLCSVLAVPVMLFPKPFYLLYKHNQEQEKRQQNGFKLLEDEESAVSGGHGHGEHGEEFEFGEVFIHQIIETIEFVLGTVSHTASYLRIWALSLAHQQLSLVFFQKTLTMGLEMPFPANGIALYFLFAAWFGVTLGVLLGMDVLECFLHTLRLHWVEFQSKFYKADGYKFEPFDIRKIVTPTGED
mmetsp:Transcript_72761/g.201765  ORF Transcript_72761/g.201765 Transcript_72761/m.201765 type:complete len:812 (+) Transcript_72761:104-2539(+)